MKTVFTALFALTICLAAPFGAANATASDKCKWETCWGAVGFGPDKKFGYSYWYSSERKASERVKSECRTCTVIKAFANSCGSLAAASNNSWGFGKGANKDAARSAAMSECKAKGGSDCTVRVWGCSRK